MEVPILLTVVAGEYMDSATVVQWLKQPGDPVSAGEVLALIETAKATMEVVAPASGVLVKTAFPVGTDVPVGEVLGWIETGAAPRPSEGPLASERLVISPAARRLAAQLGVNPTSLRPARPDGRITEADVRAAAGGDSSATEAPAGQQQPSHYTVLAPTPYRKVTAQRMTVSASIPQFQLTVAVTFEALLRRRGQLPDEQRPAMTAYFVRAAAVALAAHPRLNSTYENGEVRQHHTISIGVAVATGEGLAVPAVHDAARLSPQEIDKRLREMRDRAESRRLRLEDVQGGTFTISNLGPNGILQFAALVNPPQTAILAIGAIDAGQPGGSRCLLTLSCDHRALDGADGAAFLQTLRALLEHPRLPDGRGGTRHAKCSDRDPPMDWLDTK
jgi:pyruvate dehydrogenase E2 component (dihydrolipoamide acetyltransferase)